MIAVRASDKCSSPHLVVMAIIYVGFALYGGPRKNIALEIGVASIFVVLALLGQWVFPAAIGIGLVLHGIWDILHNPRMVETSVPRWYPPACAIYDFTMAFFFFTVAKEIALPM